jgi:peptide/nickel transport system ATP-binding protein
MDPATTDRTLTGLTRDDVRHGDVVLEVDGLTMRYGTRAGDVSAVEDVSFTLRKGDALGLVGESGCGKTSLALSLLKLLPDNARIDAGAIRLNGKDLVPLADGEMRRHRWRDLAMIFQGAMNAWNPVYRVGDQIAEALEYHWPERLSDREARERMAHLFDLVGLEESMLDRYPHEFSGGMRQRAVIAMALSCNPEVVIADEPTTALDVIVQDRILRELKQIQQDLDMSMIYISHDIAVIAMVSAQMAVMYAGEVAEIGPTERVFARPRHPYAWLLLHSTPSIKGERRKLAPLEGEPPNLLAPPSGCRFHPRCPLARRRCAQEHPPLIDIPGGGGQKARCWYWEEVPEPTGAMPR